MSITKHNLRTLLVFSLLTSAFCLLIIGCNGRRAVDQANPDSTRQITDDIGRRLSVPTTIERVITLSPDLTEIVYAVDAGNKLVGNTTFCNFPKEAQTVAKVGDTLNPNIERIIALKPHLVLISTASQLESFMKRLEEQAIPIYVSDSKDLEGVFRSILKIGDLLGQGTSAEKVVNDLRLRTTMVEQRLANAELVTVFCQVSAFPLYTAGRDAFVTDLIRRAGGRSVTASVPGAWPRLSDETALALQPDAIIVAADSETSGDSLNDLAPALRRSPAARSGRVYRMNADYLSRPGPRLVDALEHIARALHPKAFEAQ